MNWLVRRLVNQVMGAFVGSGVSLGDDGQLMLPDGLSPERVHRFIELCMDHRFASPRDAMGALFRQVGVDAHAVTLLDGIIDSQGAVDLHEAARHPAALLAALPELKRIPERFRDFLVDDLGLAAAGCHDLEAAVASTREAAATRIGCAPSWEAILALPDPVRELARPWREQALG